MTIYNKVGANISRERKKRHLTQKQLAEKMGCPISTLGAVERGSRRCSLVFLDQVAAALGMNGIDLIVKRDTFED